MAIDEKALDAAVRACLNVAARMGGDFPAAMRDAILAYEAAKAAPAEGASLSHESGERITRKDLNNAYRKGVNDGRFAAHVIDATPATAEGRDGSLLLVAEWIEAGCCPKAAAEELRRLAHPAPAGTPGVGDE